MFFRKDKSLLSYFTTQREALQFGFRGMVTVGDTPKPTVGCRLLTDPLDGGRALPEHAQGCVHDLPVEPPGGTVVPERDVFPVSGQ